METAPPLLTNGLYYSYYSILARRFRCDVFNIVSWFLDMGYWAGCCAVNLLVGYYCLLNEATGWAFVADGILLGFLSELSRDWLVIRPNDGPCDVFLVAVPVVVSFIRVLELLEEICLGFCAEWLAEPGGRFDLSCLVAPGRGGIWFGVIRSTLKSVRRSCYDSVNVTWPPAPAPRWSYDTSLRLIFICFWACGILFLNMLSPFWPGLPYGHFI